MALSKIQAESMNLADTYAFTGTVSGAGGITEADQWRVTSDFTGDQNPVASNWERNDTDFDKIGTGMTESSGIFTFPSTGIWQVTYGGVMSSTAQSGWGDFVIKVSTDSGSSYNDRAAQGNAGHYANGSDVIYSSGVSSCIIDVTNASTFRVAFRVDGNSGTVIWRASSTYMYHGATFIRLGDT